jgi:hypothetical protein
MRDVVTLADPIKSIAHVGANRIKQKSPVDRQNLRAAHCRPSTAFHMNKVALNAIAIQFVERCGFLAPKSFEARALTHLDFQVFPQGMPRGMAFDICGAQEG